MTEISNLDLSCMKLALLLTCQTGVDSDASHIANNTPANIIEQMVCQGAETVIGFLSDTLVSDCNKFASNIFNKMLVCHMSVADSIANIDYTRESP